EGAGPVFHPAPPGRQRAPSEPRGARDTTQSGIHRPRRRQVYLPEPLRSLSHGLADRREALARLLHELAGIVHDAPVPPPARRGRVRHDLNGRPLQRFLPPPPSPPLPPARPDSDEFPTSAFRLPPSTVR